MILLGPIIIFVHKIKSSKFIIVKGEMVYANMKKGSFGCNSVDSAQLVTM